MIRAHTDTEARTIRGRKTEAKVEEDRKGGTSRTVMSGYRSLEASDATEETRTGQSCVGSLFQHSPRPQPVLRSPATDHGSHETDATGSLSVPVPCTVRLRANVHIVYGDIVEICPGTATAVNLSAAAASTKQVQ